jgi:hypothetical protein
VFVNWLLCAFCVGANVRTCSLVSHPAQPAAASRRTTRHHTDHLHSSPEYTINILFFDRLVQHECIPEAILGTDVICQAKSGMGKTAVFVLSVLQQIDIAATDDYPGVLAGKPCCFSFVDMTCCCVLPCFVFFVKKNVCLFF